MKTKNTKQYEVYLTDSYNSKPTKRRFAAPSKSDLLDHLKSLGVTVIRVVEITDEEDLISPYFMDRSKSSGNAVAVVMISFMLILAASLVAAVYYTLNAIFQ